MTTKPNHDIFVIDDQHPEDMAMLQALYSRSPASVVTHLDKLKKTGSGKFMDQFYVGYGHASIGDCGQTTCFVEQVSMMVAKAIQENPLYNGQEASTRYLDYAKQAIIDPYENEASTAIQNRWKEIYNTTLEKLIAALETAHPFDEKEYKNERIWKNTLHARGFDIARSLLPLGTTTLLSWSTSLRQARENMRRMKHHPLQEVRDVAKSLFEKLTERYPHSFNNKDMDIRSGDLRDEYQQGFAFRNNLESPEDIDERFNFTPEEWKTIKATGIVARRDALDLDGVKKFEGGALAHRPKYTPLPWRMESYGKYNFAFLLDYGSFRDIQRHRNGVCQIPLLDGRFGMHPWYMGECEALLSTEDFAQLKKEVEGQFNAITQLGEKGIAVTPQDNQYFYPMGTMALIHTAYSVPETVYVGELRSGKTVHASLRPVAQKMLDVLKEDIPGIAIHGDYDADSWTAKRGEQTISAKAG